LARKILLADDSVTAQNMGRKILADAGYEVIAVNNGSAALKKIAELKPDLVILDVYMPGYSGLEVCQRLKDSQETAHTPVLLSVGKLEPFKPEEAQRVRADAFIVKPFEASELLSALSKLEDKVVPRAEPSKPGRFARAVAAAEEAGRGSRNQSSSEENGWKTRIGFPHEKKEADEKVADEASIYNPMNRDLRTVVDKSPVDDATPQAEKADAAAAPPPNLMNDVTPEEVAAIAAAVAQLQMTGAAGDVKDIERNVSPGQSSEAESSTRSAMETSVSVDATPQAPGKARPAVQSESSASTTSAELENEIPMTMAAGVERELGGNAGGPRWTAVSVALDSSEEAISLEQEMRQAYAAFAGPETDHASAVSVAVAEPEPAPSEPVSAEPVSSEPVSSEQGHSEPRLSDGPSSPTVETVPEPLVAVAAIPEPQPSVTIPEESGSASVAPAFAEHTASSAASDPANLSEPAPGPSEPIAQAADVPAAEAQYEPAPAAVIAEPIQEQEPMPGVQFAAPVPAEAEVATTAPANEVQLAPPAEPCIAQAAAASFGGYAQTGYAQIVHRAEHDLKPESEVVKSTAAAWASWRQIRDTSDAVADALVEAKPLESEVPASIPTEPALTAEAVVAHQVAQEASTAQPPENPEELASIVDSVLADLRPRLMAEISRKMAEKK